VLSSKEELWKLLGELKNVTSPFERMKILARGWKTLRGLDGSERRLLASQVGFDRAEELLTQLAQGEGKLGAKFLLRSLRRARGADPEEVESVIDALRDPQRRKEYLEQGLGELERRLLDEEQLEGLEDPSPAAEAPIEAPAPAPVAVSPPRQPVQTIEPEPLPPSERKLPAVPPPIATVEPVAAPPVPEPAPAPSGAGLVERLRRAETFMLRSKLLREGLSEARGLDAEQLRELLLAFPAGWSRRRALCCLLRERIPNSLQQAVFLLESLESKPSRRWCLATILKGWTLDDQERELLERRFRSLFHGRKLGARRNSRRPIAV